MKKHTAVRIVSYSICAALVGFTFWGIERGKNKRLELMAENEYFKNLNVFTSSINDITDTLTKAVYIKKGSDLSGLATKLYAEGEIAKESLSGLPGGNKNAETVNKFLSQVGNYAIYVSKATAENKDIESENTDMIIKLLDASKKIKSAVENTNFSYENRSEFTKNIEKNTENKVDKDSFAASLDMLEEDLSDYPTLIYDGPFSDHILTKEPLMIKNSEKKTKDFCRVRAENILGLSSGSLKYDGMEDGKILCYRFKNDDLTVSMSEYGGYLVYMRKTRNVSDYKIGNKTAVNMAKEFIKGLKVNDMKETYTYTDEGVCVINFAYLDNGVLCYTDLVKVGVASDTGEIMLIETKGYLTNHTERNLKPAKYSVSQAENNISELLAVESVKKCLIPTDGGKEVMCYEFLCKSKDKDKNDILVYVDTETNETENVFILQNSDAGTVVK